MSEILGAPLAAFGDHRRELDDVAVMELAADSDTADAASLLHDPKRSAAAEAGRLARQLMAERTERAELLGANLSAEPVWDMLLALFAARESGSQISICQLCELSQVPRTTALRWISLLVQDKKLHRHKDPADARKSYLRLTPETAVQLERLIMSWTAARKAI